MPPTCLPGFASSPDEPLPEGLLLPPFGCSREDEFEVYEIVPATGGGLMTAKKRKRRYWMTLFLGNEEPSARETTPFLPNTTKKSSLK